MTQVVRNSRIAYYVIPQLELGVSIWNSRIFVIASEAKQSLGILDFLGNSRFMLALVGQAPLLFIRSTP